MQKAILDVFYILVFRHNTFLIKISRSKVNMYLQMKEILTTVYDALKEKGYNPLNQIVGYILSEDPTYITTHNNARSLIRRVDRDTLLQTLVKYYLTD